MLTGSLYQQSFPTFLRPDKDTTGYINCSPEDLNILLFHMTKNQNVVIKYNLKSKVEIAFETQNGRDFYFYPDKTNVTIKGRERLSKGLDGFIEKYYSDQAIEIVTKLHLLFVPERYNKKYYKTTYFTLKIDFTAQENQDKYKDVRIDSLKNNELTKLTLSKQGNLRLFGAKYLKQKKYHLAMIYYREAYFVHKDVESAMLLGNLWLAMGDSTAACDHWREAATLGDSTAIKLIQSCN